MVNGLKIGVNTDSDIRFRSLYENSPDAILLTKPDGSILSANPATCQMFGMTEDEIKKAGRAGLLTFDDRVESALNERKRAGKARAELTFRRKDGSVFEGEVTSSLFTDNDGIVKTSMIIRDVTERKRAQDALMESQANYRLLAENMHDVVWIMNVDSKRFSYISPSILQLRGFTPEEVKQQALEEILTPDSWKIANEALQSVIKRDEPPRKYLELEQIHKDGSLIWTEIGFTIVRDKKGKPEYILGVSRNIAERKKVEEELKSSEERYRTLFEEAGDYILVLEVPTVGVGVPIIYDANDYALQVHGYDRDELIGKPITFLDINSSQDSIKERVKKLLNDEKLTFEAEHQRKDGSKFRVEIINKHVRVGKKDFLLSIERDITERKKVEEELKISSSLFNLATDAIFVTNLEGDIVYFNEAAYTQRGYSKDEMSKLNIRTLDAVDSVQIVDQRTKELVEKGSLVFESAHLRKDRSRMPVEVHVRIIDTNEKKLILAAVRDITERKKAEEKLIQSDRIFNNSIDMIGMAGFDGYFKVLNPAFSRTLGWSNEELLSKPWIDFVHPEDKKTTINARVSLINGQEVCQFENRYICKDGSIRWLSWNSYPYTKEKIIFAVARDITERKEAVDRLAVINEKLLVTGSLTRHDVRNKLSIIRANTYLLRKHAGNNPEIIKYLEEIDSAAEASNKMFEFSSTYEKIGSEPLLLINVGEYFKQASSLLPGLQTIEIINECEGLTVMGDSLLRQLFYNLLDNSLKHGQKVTCVHLHFKKDDGGIKLYYEDNGVGIPQAYRTKLFTEGFTTGRGSGLGLKLIRKLVEAYGWSISEEGKEGKGAQFVLTIPGANQLTQS